MSACPAHDELQQLLDDELDAAKRATVVLHISHCESCLAELASLTGTLELPPPSAPTCVASCGDEFEVDATLESLLDRLRDHPPAEWPKSSSVPPDSVLFAEPVSEDAPLGWLGSYQVLRKIGSGATGQVFAARDSRLGRLVAIKILQPYLASHPQAKVRFEREARAIAALENEHIVRIFEVGSSPPAIPEYMVMEFVAGESLDHRVARERALAPREAVEIVHQIALGLDAAHRQGIVHRDVKPSNVLLDAATGRAKIADFGLARMLESTNPLTQEGLIAGTPAYMSPEQIKRPQDADARSDVYSLGAVLYETLTGEPPFHGVLRMVLSQAMNDEPVPPRRLNDRIPRDLETICLKAMSKESSRRYATAADFAEDLKRWLKGQPVLARPIGTLSRTWRWCRRNPTLAALNAIVTTVLIAGLIDFARYATPAVQLRREAELSRQESKRLRTIVEQQRAEVARLTQSLVFDAQDAIADRPDTREQRRALLSAAIDSLTRGDAGPDDESTHHTLAVARNRLGDLSRQSGELDEAEKQYRGAFALLDVNTHADANSQRIAGRLLLAETQANLGDVSRLSGHTDEAHKWFELANRLAESVATETTVAADSTLHANALRTQSRALEALIASTTTSHRPAAAMEFQVARLSVLRQLAMLEPSNEEWVQELTRLLVKLAAAEAQLGQTSAAEAHARTALDQLDSLTEQALNPRGRRALATERLRVADVLWQVARRDEAITQARRSLDELGALPDQMDRVLLLRDRITAAERLSTRLIETKAFDAALPVLEKAEEWCRAMASESAAEFSDLQSHVAVLRNLTFVEFQRVRLTAAERWLETLEKQLSQMQADRRFKDQTAWLEWIEAQRQQISALRKRRADAK